MLKALAELVSFLTVCGEAARALSGALVQHPSGAHRCAPECEWPWFDHLTQALTPARYRGGGGPASRETTRGAVMDCTLQCFLQTVNFTIQLTLYSVDFVLHRHTWQCPLLRGASALCTSLMNCTPELGEEGGGDQAMEPPLQSDHPCTSRYLKVPEVPQSTWKYSRLPGSTPKYLKNCTPE